MINCRVNVSRFYSSVGWYFYPCYFTLFVSSMVLNMIFMRAFINYKKRGTFKTNIFNYLSFILITIDFNQSIVLFVDIFFQMVFHNKSNSQSMSLMFEIFLSFRNCLLCCHAITLLFMATNRYRAVKYPLTVKDPNCQIVKLYRFSYLMISCPFAGRLLLIFALNKCRLLTDIDYFLEMAIGLATAAVMVAIIVIYSVLFTLLCSRNFKSVSNQRKQFTKIYPYPNNIFNKKFNGKTIKRHVKKSVKFAQVLFSVTILMIVSYLPVLLTNIKLLHHPDRTIYYLFYLPALGDPLILMLSRDDIRQEMARSFGHLSMTPSATNTLTIQQQSAGKLSSVD